MKKRWLKAISLTLAACLTAGSFLQGAETARVYAAEENLTDGLVGYWDFEGDLDSDRLSSKAPVANVTAVKVGDGVALSAAGGVGGSAGVRFEGKNDSYLTLSLADAGYGLKTEQAFTVGAWIKYEEIKNTNTSSTSVFHQEGDGSGRAILTIDKDGTYGTYLDATNRFCSKPVKIGEWHHIMIAVDGAGAAERKAYFYLDGKQTNAQTLSGSLVNGNGNIRVGAHRQNAENSAVKGMMDEIRYYNKVLDTDAVKAIYALHGTLDEDVDENGTISISVDTDDELREIPSAMFGINHRYHKYGYGSWDQENSKPYDAFQEIVKEAGFGSVRYPGGTVSNLFSWKDAIGPREERTTVIAGNNFYSDAGEVPVDAAFGVDEAMGWIYDDLGSEAIFVYGLGRGNPADAADLVEYLNAPNDGSNPNGGVDWAAVRAKNGHEEPYGVIRFELGNEFSDTGQDYWMSGRSQNGKGTEDLYIEGDIMEISGQRSYYQVNNRVAKKGDWRSAASRSEGKENEERYVYYLPVIEDSAEVFVAGQKWEIVDSLDGQGEKNVCTFDYGTGKIVFGDGLNGNIPSAGAEITCNYQTRQSGFVDYYDAMKAVADEIGMEIEIYSGIVDRLQKNFIRKMNEKGHDDKYDGVIIHPYSSGYGNADAYEASLAKAKAQAEYVKSHKTLMHELTGDNSKEVAVSEFGILGPASDYQTSLGHAMYIANHMIDCVNAGAAYQNKHCLVDFTVGDNLGAWQQCVIQCHNFEGGNQYVSTPSARLFDLFNHMTGNVEVNQEVKGNRESYSDGNGVVESVNVYSTKDEEGNAYVMAVNNEKSKSVKVDISVDGRDLTGSRMDVWFLSSENVDDKNTLEEPDKVSVQKRTEQVEGKDVSYELLPHSVYSFKVPAEQVSISVKAEAGGTASGSATVRLGSSVTVKAVPQEGYVFAGWYLGEVKVSEQAEYSFVAEKETELLAKFVKKQDEQKPPIKDDPSIEEEPPIQQPVQAPAAPKGVKAKKTKKGIQISWKKVSGANGYLIYRSYKQKTGFKKIAQIKKAGTRIYLDKKVKRGKMAYYKIKAYRKADGKNLAGKFSKTVKKKR